ncbi:hypothetical protein GGI20_004445 [Coemansia sp. BCRC 34301]|nr:hypothetical protein GGI20_004445 [Coemansia sp. BCRC 34301]
MDGLLRTPKTESRRIDDDLSLQSPPMLAHTPYLSHSVGTPENERSSVFGKRTIANMATPRKPGSAEARKQQEAAYINTPARAPHSTKRQMRSESPLGFKISLGHDEQAQLILDDSVADCDDQLLAQRTSSFFSPPRFALPVESTGSAGKGAIDDDDMLAECMDEIGSEPATLDETEALCVSTGELESEAKDAKEAAAGVPVTSELPVDDFIAACYAAEGEVDAESDSDIEFTTANTRTEGDGISERSVTDVTAHPEEKTGTESEEMDCSVEAPAAVPTSVSQSIMSELDSAFPALDDTRDADPPEMSTAPVARFEIPVVDHSKVERTALSTAKILSDPELLYAASIPLPSTPALANQSTPSANQDLDGADSADFYIPTSWLMNPSTATRNDRRQPQEHVGMTDPSSPSLGSADAQSSSLIPVTPVNQRLLDSLEIQWVSPRRVPKFSEVDMDAVHADYEDKMKRQNELREMLLDALKDEYALNMRKQADMADQALREAEDLFQKHAAQREREFEERLRAAEANHLGEISRRDEDTRIQEAQLSREIENLITERAEITTELAQTRQTLDEYVATSGRLLDEKESETNGLTRELGKLTLDRQRLQEQLSEALKSAEDLLAKHSDAMQLIDALEAAKKESDERNATLHNDVLVSEERAAKIREYAESKLGEANAEIASAHEQLAAVRQEAATLKAQATKSDARARSLQIQLDSTKRQNEELLALFFGHGGFDPITGSGSFTSGVGAIDAAGNSFVRVDKDTRVQGLGFVGLNENTVSNQLGGPAVEANGAVVVTVD